MPSGHGWWPTRRRRASSTHTTSHPQPPASSSAVSHSFQTETEAVSAVVSHQELDEEPVMLQIARQLWSSDYSELFHSEYLHNKSVLGSGYETQPSSYARRLQGQRLAEYEQRMQGRERDAMSIALHSANMRTWTPSFMARSVTFFGHTTSFTHGIESRGRRLASRPTTLKFLRMMRDVRPPPRFEVGGHV